MSKSRKGETKGLINNGMLFNDGFYLDAFIIHIVFRSTGLFFFLIICFFLYLFSNYFCRFNCNCYSIIRVCYSVQLVVMDTVQ